MFRTPGIILENVERLSVGDGHVLAIGRDGSLWVWGNNNYGQLGIAVSEHQPVPIRITPDMLRFE